MPISIQKWIQMFFLLYNLFSIENVSLFLDFLWYLLRLLLSSAGHGICKIFQF